MGYFVLAAARKDNMTALGIEETGGAGGDAKGDKKEEKKEIHEPPIVFEPVTLDSLRQEKGFQKIHKKQSKDLEALKKKHIKERTSLQKTQNGAIEKLIKGKSKEEIKADQNVRKLVTDQTSQWSEMCERHKKEEWELLKTQVTDQQDTLKRLMETCQAGQMKQVEAKHERETKSLNGQQAKTSVETAKEVANDKTLKTKGEKDRRLREKKQNNIKRFMDEKKVGARATEIMVTEASIMDG